MKDRLIELIDGNPAYVSNSELLAEYLIDNGVIVPPCKASENEYENKVLTTAIRTFGETHQECLAAEECAELIQAINHKHRGRKNNMAEEIADVEIMLEQLKIINNCRDEVDEIHNQKVNRLFNRIIETWL